MTMATTRKHQKLKDIRSLMVDLDKLYHQHRRTPTKDLLSQINHKRSSLDTLLSEQMEKSLHWSRVHFLLHNNSALATFVRKLKQSIKLTQSFKLRDTNGNITSHPNKVLKMFSYYQKLLANPQATATSTPQTWLETLSLPKITDEQLQSLNAPCTEEEIASIISSLKPSKALGPDGFTAMYYKKFAGLLIPKNDKTI